jgi:hypothetical protein
MALIGNPMDFDRIRQRYESITYPESRKTFQTPFEQTRSQYSGLLTGTGSETIRQDAAQPGEQIQFRFNPVTGRTETIIPEYMGTYRTDQTDFFPGSSPFQSIYSTGDSEIDPTTGKLRETTQEPLAMQSLPNIISGGGDGFNNPYSANYTGGYMAGNKGYPTLDHLTHNLKSGFGLFGSPMKTHPRSPGLDSYEPKIPGLFGNIIQTVKEFSLSDLVSNIDKGDNNNKPGPTTTAAQGSTTVTRDGSGPMGSGGGNGRGTPGGRAGGTAGGSAGAGGAAGRSKGGKYT